MIRLSIGTAVLLGMQKSLVQEPPTTAYIMSGQGCTNNCSFCAQAKTSSGAAGLLSRVTWPEFSLEETARSIAAAYEQGGLQRACIQVVSCAQGIQMLYKTLDAIKKAAPQLPVSVSAALTDIHDLNQVFERGADAVNISLDGASRRIFESTKGKSWEKAWCLLMKAAKAHPNRIRTHIISGMGESEKDIVETIQKCSDLEIGVGLFAFTPIKGTALEANPQPSLHSYRRLQAANYLITNGYSRSGHFSYQTNGSIKDFGISPVTLEYILHNGKAFETSGCRGCNRPFYNESPRQLPYNYPRPLTREEIDQAIREVLTKD